MNRRSMRFSLPKSYLNDGSLVQDRRNRDGRGHAAMFGRGSRGVSLIEDASLRCGELAVCAASGLIHPS
jgi:hypothetical protein